MVTSYKVGGTAISKPVDFFGLSTDTKPVDENIPNGSVFYAMDTKKAYMYDLEHKVWLEQ